MDNAHSNKIGSHGGTIIKIKEGFVEVSIFEANTPPCFRLYFFDANNNPSSIISKVSLETIRPDGVTQIFHCNQIDNYLESFEHIPEPHEFKLHLTINKKIYNVSFTEAEHHHEGHSHHHENGTGILGWIKGKYAHSHNAVDKIDNTMESNERGIQALKISLVGLGVTALLQLIVVMISGSVSLLADTIHNFADCATSIPLWIAFALTKRGASRKFTYGYGKTEDIAGIVIILIIFLSACFAAYETIMKFLQSDREAASLPLPLLRTGLDSFPSSGSSLSSSLRRRPSRSLSWSPISFIKEIKLRYLMIMMQFILPILLTFSKIFSVVWII